MNKPHKHADIIKAWADGAKVQVKNVSISQAADWLDVNNPSWDTANEYRIKPREFEDGAWYPIIVAKTQYVARYLEYNQAFKIGDSSIAVKPERIEWIGSKIEIEWPEESEHEPFEWV
jgi:hypothetical protein